MQLELNGRSYLILAAIIVAGLFMEALKFWPTNHSLSSAEEILQISQPYSVSDQTLRQTTKVLNVIPRGAPIPPPAPALPALDMKDQITKWQTEQDKLKAEEEKKKAAAKNWHWVWNKKLQKWEWKKKKKKKPAAAKQADAQSVASESDAAPTDSKPTAAQPAGVTGPAMLLNPDSTASFGFGQASGGGKTPPKILSASEWQDYLETSPAQSKTDNFVNQHKQHLVTDQVFYQVITNMLKNNKLPVQQQGVYALSKSPSVQSFDMLASEHSTVQTSSPLYQATDQALQQYQTVQNVSILQSVIGQSSQQGAQTLAMTELQQSVDKNLGTTPPTGNPSAQSANASHYQGFVGPLTQLQNGGGPLASQAEQILAKLAQFGIH